MVKIFSLKKSRDFNRVYRRGVHVGGHNLVLYVSRSRNDFMRLGISASKKLGCAVKRNRVRRIIKEAFFQGNFNLSYDIVVVPKSDSVNMKMQEILKEICYLLKKVKFSETSRKFPYKTNR